MLILVKRYTQRIIIKSSSNLKYQSCSSCCHDSTHFAMALHILCRQTIKVFLFVYFLLYFCLVHWLISLSQRSTFVSDELNLPGLKMDLFSPFVSCLCLWLYPGFYQNRTSCDLTLTLYHKRICDATSKRRSHLVHIEEVRICLINMDAVAIRL